MLAYRQRDELTEAGLRNRQLVIDKFSWSRIAENVAGVVSASRQAG